MARDSFNHEPEFAFLMPEVDLFRVYMNGRGGTILTCLRPALLF